MVKGGVFILHESLLIYESFWQQPLLVCWQSDVDYIPDGGECGALYHFKLTPTEQTTMLGCLGTSWASLFWDTLWWNRESNLWPVRSFSHVSPIRVVDNRRSHWDSPEKSGIIVMNVFCKWQETAWNFIAKHVPKKNPCLDTFLCGTYWGWLAEMKTWWVGTTPGPRVSGWMERHQLAGWCEIFVLVATALVACPCVSPMGVHL